MVFRYCFGMIMSVSTLMIFSGAATPSSVVNLSMSLFPRLRPGFSPIAAPVQGQFAKGLIPGSRLDRLHVGVRQPKMMADLVDQHVTDDMAQGLLVLGPIVQ